MYESDDLESVRNSFLPPEYNPETDRKSIFGLSKAPTFTPTLEEFQNPLAYIASISAVGSTFGIIKIIPPKKWKPDFSLDPQVSFPSLMINLRISLLLLVCKT